MMKLVSSRTLITLVTCIVLTMVLSSLALASCGDSFAAMASGKAVAGSPLAKPLEASAATDGPDNPSMVGLWHIQFVVGGQTIQEAFQIWNFGGTEAHNPNGDPRGGTMCLGTWVKTPGGVFKLAHRVWNYDTNGNFVGTIHLSETISLTNKGSAQTGSFKLDFYDPEGAFITEVAGDVVGQRIQVE